MKKILYFLFAFMLILSACSDKKQAKTDKIKELETAVKSMNAETLDISKSKELAEAYLDYADTYPDDTAAANFYFKAASILMNAGNPNKAIELFDKIITDYPDYRKVSESMFLKAFTYDNYLKNIKKAEEGYRAFIRKYPDNEFADDARSLLDLLGKTPEQIGAELKAKNEKDSLKTTVVK